MEACQSLSSLTHGLFFCGREIKGTVFETFQWDGIYVFISVIICIAYSSIASEMYARNIANNKDGHITIIKTGSVFGLGIFSMHFIGMFALTYPGPMQYDVFITIFSLIVAVSGVSLSLYLLHHKYHPFIYGSVFGLTVCMMHYSGMLSIANNPFHMHHNTVLLFFALLYSIFGSMYSLKFFEKYLKKNNHKTTLLLGSIAIGLTISGVHYLAMGSLEFSVNADFYQHLHSWYISRNGIIGFTFVLLIATIAAYINDSMNAEITLKSKQEQLEQKNKNISETLNKLQEMQSQLVESEKMASLGQLISGVAHEINTPVGICITSSSYLKVQSDEFFTKFHNSTLTKSDFEVFMDRVNSGYELIGSNLTKASSLIKNFKQVAVDQSADEIREFYLKQYIEEVLSSLHHKIKNSQFKINITCESDFHVKTYAGSISTIISHLFNNSLIHGFEGMDKGIIHIKVLDLEDNAKIVFSDTGNGMHQKDIANIADPFFTTKRGGDCSGLGMYVVYNQATQKLAGSLNCRSINVFNRQEDPPQFYEGELHGLEVEITFPKFHLAG